MNSPTLVVAILEILVVTATPTVKKEIITVRPKDVHATASQPAPMRQATRVALLQTQVVLVYLPKSAPK